MQVVLFIGVPLQRINYIILNNMKKYLLLFVAMMAIMSSTVVYAEILKPFAVPLGVEVVINKGSIE